MSNSVSLKQIEPAGQSEDPQVLSCQLADDATIPNSSLPLLVFQRAFTKEKDLAATMEGVFAANRWVGSWRDGIYRYHHYHSTAHEVLGVYSGFATVRFGGERGTTQRLETGDVVVIPAGVAHKNLTSSSDFAVVGAYPAGQDPDMCYGKPGERPNADHAIAKVPLPKLDPVYGANGPLQEHWRIR